MKRFFFCLIQTGVSLPGVLEPMKPNQPLQQAPIKQQSSTQQVY